MDMDCEGDVYAKYGDVVFILELGQRDSEMMFDYVSRWRLGELLSVPDELGLCDAVELFDEMVGVHLAGNLEMNGYANRGAVGERRGEFGVVGVKLKWLAIKRGLFALCDADTAGKRDSEHCQDDNDGKRRKRRKRRIGM
jgi:hypothetical protein